MKWEEATVVGAQAPNRIGVRVGQPIVRDRSGRMFFVADAGAFVLQEGTLISKEDLESGAIDSIVSVPPRPALQGQLTVVTSLRFNIVMREAESPQPFKWEQLPSGMRFAYLGAPLVTDWRAQTANNLLQWVQDTLLRAGSGISKLHQAEEMLRQVRYVTEPSSDQRLRMYAYLYHLLSTVDPGRWDAVSDLAQREFALDEASIRQRVARYQAQLAPRTSDLFERSVAIKSIAPVYRIPELAAADGP